MLTISANKRFFVNLSIHIEEILKKYRFLKTIKTYYDSVYDLYIGEFNVVKIIGKKKESDALTNKDFSPYDDYREIEEYFHVSDSKRIIKLVRSIKK